MIPWIKNLPKNIDKISKDLFLFISKSEHIQSLVTAFMEFLYHNTYIIKCDMVLLFLPPMITALTLLFDFIFLQKYYYFYKVLWILIFPLITQIILWIIQRYVELNMENINSKFLL